MATVYGEISYENNTFGDRKGGKDLFLRLDKGDNEVRLVTNPFQYLVHKIKKDPTDKKDFGKKIYCSEVHGSCPACAMNDKAKPRWFYGVISRKDNTYKLLDVSYGVFSGIKKLANNKRWGDPTKYDINIIVDPDGSPMTYYTVQPIAKEPLSATDQQMKDNADLDDLKRRTLPLTPDKVQEALNKLLGDSAPAPSKAESVVKHSTPQVDMSDSDEDFPDFEASAS